MNSSRYYIAYAFTCFSFHVEDEELKSIFNLTTGVLKFWYVLPSLLTINLETFLGKELIAQELFNDHGEGVRQIS